MTEQNWNKLISITDPRMGRPDPETGYSKEKGSWVIDVDKDHMALVDYLDEKGKYSEKTAYFRFKDDFWFMRGGHATAIRGVRWDPGKREAHFEYITLEECIFGGPCRHRNGDLLDNRRINLDAPREEQQEAALGATRQEEPFDEGEVAVLKEEVVEEPLQDPQAALSAVLERARAARSVTTPYWAADRLRRSRIGKAERSE